MDGFRQYVISVAAAAILCSILSSLVKKGPANELIKMVSGLFLAYTLLSPLPHIDFDLKNNSLVTDISEGKAIAESSYQNSQQAVRTIIKSELESYIQDKAESLNLELTAEVLLREDESNMPQEIRIYGEAAPYAKKQMEHYIISELGITKENLHWTG